MPTGLLGFMAASGIFADAMANNDFRKAAENALGLVLVLEEMFKNARQL